MSRLKKRDRARYLCGSPGHLRRDCPAISRPHPMLHRGNAMFLGAMPAYVSPYWNGLHFPPIRPFANPYDLSPMMPFNSTVFPAEPLNVPAYMPCMFGGLPAFGGFSRMGGTAAAVKNNIDHWLYPLELDGQDYVKRRQCDEAERAYDRKIYPSRERSERYSEDSFNKNSLTEKWHSRTIDDGVYSDEERLDRSSLVAGQNPKLYYHSGRSKSEVVDIPSISSRHSWERHQHGHRSSKKRSVGREHCESDSSNKKRDSERKIIKHDAEKKHYNHSEFSPELDHSTDLKKKQREKHSGLFMIGGRWPAGPMKTIDRSIKIS